ncbi:MAG: hypothetical protein AAFQ63_23915 [Cyanobacteria bacterium J06621_11]
MTFDDLVSVIVDTIVSTRRQLSFEYEDGDKEGEYIFTFADKVVRDQVAIALMRSRASVERQGDTDLKIQI